MLGARVTDRLGIQTSWMTIVHRMMALPTVPVQADRTSQKWEASGQEKGESGKHYSKAKLWGIVRAALAVALTIQVNCTCPLAQPVEKSVDWDWSPRSHLVQGRYDRQVVRHST